MGRYLYVRNISLQATEEDVFKLFSVAGKVVSIHLTKDRQTGKFNGCGFIKMSTDKEAREAINSLDEARYIDRVLMVEEARSNLEPGSKSGGKGGKRPAPKGDRPQGPKPAEQGMEGAPKPAPSKPTAPGGAPRGPAKGTGAGKGPGGAKGAPRGTGRGPTKGGAKGPSRGGRK